MVSPESSLLDLFSRQFLQNKSTIPSKKRSLKRNLHYYDLYNSQLIRKQTIPKGFDIFQDKNTFV